MSIEWLTSETSTMQLNIDLQLLSEYWNVMLDLLIPTQCHCTSKLICKLQVDDQWSYQLRVNLGNNALFPLVSNIKLVSYWSYPRFIQPQFVHYIHLNMYVLSFNSRYNVHHRTSLYNLWIKVIHFRVWII